MSSLYGHDIDGTLTAGIVPVEPYVIISGRTFEHYDDFVKKLASKAPVYIRGTGAPGDRESAGNFKSQIINLLGVTEFFEDDPVQIEIIQKVCPKCKITKV